jgi:tetratricopeptide (TPR) repeat protein
VKGGFRLTTPGWASAQLADLCPGERQVPIRRHFGIQAFGINAWRGLEVGDKIIHGHDEIVTAEHHEELYFVLEGRATFTLDDQEADAPVGTLLFVAPEIWRSAVAAEPGTVILAAGAPRGRPFVPSAWEQWSILGIEELFAAGRYAEAAVRYRDALDVYPGHPGVHFNLACLLSLAGNADEALDHLARSIELEPSNKAFARSDRDLEPLKVHQRFSALTAD